MRGGLLHSSGTGGLRCRFNLRTCTIKLGRSFINQHTCLMPANMQGGRLDTTDLPGNIFVTAGLTRLPFQLTQLSFQRLERVVDFFQITFRRP